MTIETICINGKAINSHDTCNVIITFECVEPTYSEQLNGGEAYCVLHKVELQPTSATDVKLVCPLDDSDVLAHFESLLSTHWHGYPVYSRVTI